MLGVDPEGWVRNFQFGDRFAGFACKGRLADDQQLGVTAIHAGEIEMRMPEVTRADLFSDVFAVAVDGGYGFSIKPDPKSKSLRIGKIICVAGMMKGQALVKFSV